MQKWMGEYLRHNMIYANVCFDRVAVDMRINQIKQKMNQNLK